MKTKLSLDQAQEIADRYRDELLPYCERLEIAGSIRRKKPMVGDIEMVAIPKFETWGHDLLGNPTLHNALEEEVSYKFRNNGLVFTKSGPRYKQIQLQEGINLDLFIVLPPAQWGVIFLLRTGPEVFSKMAVTQRNKGGHLPSYCLVKDGQVFRYGELFPTPEEDDYLELLGLPGLKPEARA